MPPLTRRERLRQRAILEVVDEKLAGVQPGAQRVELVTTAPKIEGPKIDVAGPDVRPLAEAVDRLLTRLPELFGGVVAQTRAQLLEEVGQARLDADKITAALDRQTKALGQLAAAIKSQKHTVEVDVSPLESVLEELVQERKELRKALAGLKFPKVKRVESSVRRSKDNLASGRVDEYSYEE